MYFNLNNGMKLHVYENTGHWFDEIAIDLIDRNGAATPLVLAGRSDADGDDEVHVYVYKEDDDEPVEHVFHPDKCNDWRF